MKKSKTVVLPGPAAAELHAALGTTRSLWEMLVDHVEEVYPPVTREWKLAPKSGGWFLRLRRKERTLLYLLPREGFFLTAFVFGERATAAVRAGGLPAHVVAALNEARPYVEGRGIRLETRAAADLATMQALVAIKASH